MCLPCLADVGFEGGIDCTDHLSEVRNGVVGGVTCAAYECETTAIATENISVRFWSIAAANMSVRFWRKSARSPATLPFSQMRTYALYALYAPNVRYALTTL